jgi:hypothetical protein
MRRRWSQRGEGNLGCIFWTAVLAVVVLVAWKMVPVKIKSAELYDFMVDQAGYASNASNSAPVIKKRILSKARELDLPLDKDHLTVERTSDNLGGRIKMRATYTVPVDFPGYTYLWSFDHEVDRPVYIF